RRPYPPAQLREALAKCRRFEAHFAGKLAALRRALGRSRRRLLTRDGEAFVVVALDEVAYFEVRDGLTALVHRDGRRLALDRTLADVEAELDGPEVFRLNRQYLAHADAIVGFRPYFKGLLLVQLLPAAPAVWVYSQPHPT